MKTLTNPFFVEMERGARRAEQELGITLKVKTAAQETSIEQQIQLVEDLTAAKVAAIVIAPGDSQRLVPALKRAADAGIRTVNIDNRLDPDGVKQAGMSPVPFVSVDNRAGAHQAGKFLAEGINSTTEAAILEGIRSADNARQRTEGARAALQENPHIRLVASETANWKIDEAYAVTKSLFGKHPRIKLLFAANDMMAIGAASAEILGWPHGGHHRPAGGRTRLPGRCAGPAHGAGQHRAGGHHHRHPTDQRRHPEVVAMRIADPSWWPS
jgi:ribose transport system substrate-binding protein